MRKILASVSRAPQIGGPAERWMTGPQLVEYYGVTSMTIWRWWHDPELGFPRPLTVRRRNFWSVSDLRAWERRMALANADRADSQPEQVGEWGPSTSLISGMTPGRPPTRTRR
jgi:predicted DNA-binding transcriptional regulator AlpA